MGLEQFPNFIPQETPETSKKPGNIFLDQAEKNNPTVETLKKEHARISNEIGAIRQQMAKGAYFGKLSDLSKLEDQKNELTRKINAKFDTSLAYKENFSGRDGRADKFR